MKTKQRIINQAIISYNTLGVTNVTSRDIAKALKISHGNLEYHFPNKEALLMAIYKQMKKDISQVYKEGKHAVNPFLHFNELLIKLEQFHNDYLFFNLDVLEISRNYPEVSALLNKTFQIRKAQMSHFYDRFTELGYFKKETIPGMYLRLQHTIRIMITFWKSQQEVLPYFENVQKPKMSTYVWDLLTPHMTEKGVQAYNTITQTNTIIP
ncbi:TetR/AcrR family transcriptional regulator [Snuella lapsa]